MRQRQARAGSRRGAAPRPPRPRVAAEERARPRCRRGKGTAAFEGGFGDDETYSDDGDYGDDDFDANSDGDGAAGSLTGGESDDTRLTPVGAPSADSAKTKAATAMAMTTTTTCCSTRTSQHDEPARGAPVGTTANWT